jgi:aminoglycoside phosphotransferase (APT) family kinase protein
VEQHPRSGRNRIAVREAGDAKHLVKSSGEAGDAWREGWFYATHGPSYGFAPRCLELDRAGRTVVLELLPEARDAQELGRTDPTRALRALTELGEALASLHRLPLDSRAPLAQPVLPPIERPSAAHLQASTPALWDCLRDLQGRRGLIDGYERWRAGLVADRVVHGDLKLDNVIVAEERVLLADWELAGRGDPSVDVGGAIGSMATVWLDGLALSPDEPAERWVDRGAVSFGALRAAIAAFADGYAGVARDRDWSADAVRSAAYWLVARAVSEASLSRAYAPATMLKLRVASSLAKRPERVLSSSPPARAAL